MIIASSNAVGVEGVQAAVSRSSHPLDEVRLVTDGMEFLSCLFSKGSEEVAQAVWSKSPYLATSCHRGLAAELASLGLDPPYAESTPGYAALLQNLTDV